jgi:CHAT domain-containing protein
VVQHVVRRLASAAGGSTAALLRRRNEAAEAFATAFRVEQSGFEQREANESRLEAGAELATARARLQQAHQELVAAFPEYESISRDSSLTISDAQSLVRPNEAILLAVPSSFGTHVILVRHDRFEWVRSGLNAEQVNAAVQRLRWDLGARVYVEEETRQGWAAEAAGQGFDRQTAFRLYQELIQPFADHLRDLDNLYVVAAGPLAGLPFHVLVTRAPERADADPAALRNTVWFGEEVPLTHLPSISSLALLRRLPAQSGESRTDYIGIGDPILEGTPSERGRGLRNAHFASRRFGQSAMRSGVSADVEWLRALPRLPGTALELEAVRQQLRAPSRSLLLADRATERNVRQTNLRGIRLLIFSTHGLTAEEAIGVGEAGLVLTPPPEGSTVDDGYLAASEIANLQMDADWAILSACNTATGDAGEGFGALVRSFFAAGARNILASHWPVSDEVAPILISRTLAHERSGMSRARSFQAAMREVRLDASHDAAGSSWAHPFYWAPFVLVGAGR